MTDQTKTLDRIRKVLAKAEGTDNHAEAEMLMAKVQAMLTEHNVTLLDVAEADNDDPVGVNRHAAYCWVSNSWIKTIAGPLARLYGAQIVITTSGNKILLSVAGRESARVTWELMLPFVVAQVKREAKALRNKRIAEGLPVKGAGAVEREVGNALALRIGGMVAEADRAESARVAEGGRALVPVDLVQQAMEAAFSLRTSRASYVRTSADGHAAASRVSLHRQTGGSTVARIGSR